MSLSHKAEAPTATLGRIRHVPELDGIRGLAVLVVVLLHFEAPFHQLRAFGPLTPLIGAGGSGVDVFFVLSGYLITAILLATRDAGNYFRAFYARRALRIMPLYVLALLFYFGLELPLAHRYGLVLGFHESEQVWYWTFLANWRQGLGFNDGAGVAHFWSLAIEEQFYVLFSVLVLWLSRRNLTVVCVAMIALSIGLRVALWQHGNYGVLEGRLTVLHLDPLAMGALLALSSKARVWGARLAWLLIPLGLAGALSSLPAEMRITAAGLASMGAIAFSLTRPVRVLRWNALRSLGKYSYAMYVLHYLLASAVANLAKRHQTKGMAVVSVLLGTALSYAIAWVSWQVLEEPVSRLKRRFPYRARVEAMP